MHIYNISVLKSQQNFLDYNIVLTFKTEMKIRQFNFRW